MESDMPETPASELEGSPTPPAAAETPVAAPMREASATLDMARDTLERLGDRARAAVLGRDEVIELVLIALISDGHVLLEDFPGSGKTTLARAIGEAVSAKDSGYHPFRRVQFTPDLLPSDITGTNIFDPNTNDFDFRRGPLFAHVVLADEINRTSPKVQSAMLEAMAEKQVTLEDATHALDPLFFVIATQNPLDLAGTYPLPTPQLDRFLFKIEMKHIERADEVAVLAQYPTPSLDHGRDAPGVSRDELLRARAALRHGVTIAPAIREALVDLARALRDDDRVLQGASTRGLVLALPALQARAAMRGRDFVTPDDIDALAPHLFGHRIECAPGADTAEKVIRDCLRGPLDALAKASLNG